MEKSIFFNKDGKDELRKSFEYFKNLLKSQSFDRIKYLASYLESKYKGSEELLLSFTEIDKEQRQSKEDEVL